jgi:hypothetical protein
MARAEKALASLPAPIPGNANNELGLNRPSPVLLLSDTLVTSYGVAFSGLVDTAPARSPRILETADGRKVTGPSEWRPPVVVLANGETLTVDANTEIGRYELKDRSLLLVETPKGYPRGYLHTEPRRNVLRFRIDSSRQVGSLTWRIKSKAVGAAEIDEADVLARYARAIRRNKYCRALVDSAADCSFEFPHDWYRQAEIALPEGTGEFRVVWIEYGEPNPEYREPPGPTRLANGAIKFPVVDPLALKPRYLEVDPESIVANGKIVLAAIVDLDTRRVVSTNMR